MHYVCPGKPRGGDAGGGAEAVGVDSVRLRDSVVWIRDTVRSEQGIEVRISDPSTEIKTRSPDSVRINPAPILLKECPPNWAE